MAIGLLDGRQRVLDGAGPRGVTTMGVQQTITELYTRNVVRIHTTVSTREPIVNGNTTKSTTSTTIMEAIMNYNFIVKNVGCFSSDGNFSD